MPISNKINHELSLMSYQNFDGSNTSMAMYSQGAKLGKKADISFGVGASTNFKACPSLVFEGKAKYKFDENYSMQLRVREINSKSSEVTQIRLSPGYSGKVGDTTSIYVNPYVSGKVNHQTGNWTTDIGVFGGVTQKLGDKFSMFAEVQRYDLAHIADNSGKNWGFNVGLSYKF